MSSKISPKDIVADHFDTWQDRKTGKWSLKDFGAMLVVPLLAGGAMAWFDLRVVEFGEFIAGAAVLTGFAFGLLVFIFQLRLESVRDGTAPSGGVLASLLNELFTNVAYAILVGLATVVSLVVAGAVGQPLAAGEVVVSEIGKWASAVVIFLSSHFVMTLLMCLKRTYVAYDRSVRH